MILYGWNNYLLKTVQLHDLGIIRPDTPDVKIEYRQKYFHLFFIPVFPLGRFWAIRQQGQMYQPSADIQQALNNVQVNTKNKIWAWTGILLVVAGMLFYNINEKLESASYAKKAAASKQVLTAFFQDKKNTDPLASKLRSVNYLMDSSVNDEAYDKKEIDTSLTALMNLYLTVKSSQKDSVSGYDEKNTLVFSCLNHKKNKGDLPGDDIRKALSDGTWNGYSDTSSVYNSLRKLKEYRYLLVLKEYNRLHPDIQETGFSSGISLVNGTVFDLETKAIVHNFKIMASNSDSVSQFTYGRKGERRNVPQSQWASILENDLNGNILKEASKYIFNKEKTDSKEIVSRL